jgi:hypothetical protein
MDISENKKRSGKVGMPRLYKEAEVDGRTPRHEILKTDVVVGGGGIAGVCAALAAAREGAQVVLIQDRPVLGGNASSEVRLWMLGATSHMGNNNRWSREGAIVGEILVENLFRNREGNPLILDTILLEMVEGNSNITLLLNTCIFDIEKRNASEIESVKAFCSQNSTRYTVHGSAFIDCSGDGIISFIAGAAFRMGAESKDEFGEKMAPTEAFGNLLGHSLYFYSKDTGKDVNFIKPAFCDVDIDSIYRYRSFSLTDQGCNFWWVEYGGRRDTVHDSEMIKWELWKVVYGIWDYIKNSGKFPDSRTHTLEWVGTIPGKRESRRFEGLKMLKQQDIVERRRHPDAVSFGGWSLDLHPADGVYSKDDPCWQLHSKGVYQVPLGATISRNVRNLAYGGRIISTSHVAFGSTRVMATCGNIAQATGVAVAYSIENGLPLQELLNEEHIRQIQRRLFRIGHHIPGIPMKDPEDLVREASITASSEFKLKSIPSGGPGQKLDTSSAMLIPVKSGKIPRISLPVIVSAPTELYVELRLSEQPDEYTPEVTLETVRLQLDVSDDKLDFAFESHIPDDRYVFICFLKNENVILGNSEQRITGVLSVFNGTNKAVSNSGKQEPGQDYGVDSFEFWCPQRRPEGRNLALTFEKTLYTFSGEQLRSGYARPTNLPNAWIADPDDPNPTISLKWDTQQTISRIVVNLDTDFDHGMESVLQGHPESIMPFCVQQISVWNDKDECLGEVSDNHQSQVRFEFKEPITTDSLKFRVKHPSETCPASIFSINCY